MIKPTKRKVVKKIIKRKNPDLHNFISLSLENIDKTKKKLKEAEKYLLEILNSTEFTNDDLRKMNDEEYRGDNPLYELYQSYRTVLGRTTDTVEETKNMIEMINSFKIGNSKKRYIRRY